MTLVDDVAQWLARRDMDGSRQSWHEDAAALVAHLAPRVGPVCDHPACGDLVEHWPGAAVCRAPRALPTLAEVRARYVRPGVVADTPRRQLAAGAGPGEGHPPDV